MEKVVQPGPEGILVLVGVSVSSLTPHPWGSFRKVLQPFTCLLLKGKVMILCLPPEGVSSSSNNYSRECGYLGIKDPMQGYLMSLNNYTRPPEA